MKTTFSVIDKLNFWLALSIAGVAGTGAYALWLQHQAHGRAQALLGGSGEAAAALQQALASDRRDALVVLVAALAVVGALGVMLRLSVRTGILRSIRAAAHVIGRVAEGDLTARVGVRAVGETQKMLDGLERMTGELGTIVRLVSSGAGTVADASAQISQGNRELSQRTEEQAAALERTAHAMEELTTTVAQNAEHAKQAAELAAQASQVARRGGEAVTQVVDTMGGIAASSQRIQDIIGLIDGIAFQTNILALNAAVEAARAGEQGRGFAVVAGEVRSLSQRTAAAARDVKELIDNSVRQVEAGARQAAGTGETMREVVGSVERLRALIAEIAAASREQSGGLAEINGAVAQMERVVQQDAALVEQAAAAADAMAQEARTLLGAVSRFQVEGARGKAVTPVMPLAARPRRALA